MFHAYYMINLKTKKRICLTYFTVFTAKIRSCSYLLLQRIRYVSTHFESRCLALALAKRIRCSTITNCSNSWVSLADN
jgi:hypothetical protein